MYFEFFFFLFFSHVLLSVINDRKRASIISRQERVVAAWCDVI